MPHPERARTCVLLAAAGAPWEATVLRRVEHAGMVVLKRCVDLADLLGTASNGQAQVAVVSPSLPGLDADSVRLLDQAGATPVAVVTEAGAGLRERMGRLGVGVVDDLAGLPARIEERLAAPAPAGPPPSPPEERGRHGRGRRIAVWGPTGAPGRSLVATNLAALRASRGHPVSLLDVDPYGGAVGQLLGVLDEVSGLLTAARLANDGALDDEGTSRCLREVRTGLGVVTGLPRPDRWLEVREGVVSALVDRCAGRGDVVVDCGFSLEELPGTGPSRNTTTREALGTADEVVVVGSAEPTGLPRLARGLLDLAETSPEVPTRVVVNRLRDGLGWRRRDIVGMVEGYAGAVPVHFLPEDRAAVDRSMVLGRALVELGGSSLLEALEPLVDALFGADAPVAADTQRRRRRRVRAAGRARAQVPKSR